MIEGLKLTMTGEELRKRLEERIKEHERLVAHYKREAKREPDPTDEEDFVLPEHMCDYEQQLHGWRAEALADIREHIEGGEVYRLNALDLEFGEILPVQPGLVAQEEYEREQRVGFSLERIAKEIGRSSFGIDSLAAAVAEHRRIAAVGRVTTRKSPAKARAGRR
jgi:hypothetical protein